MSQDADMRSTLGAVLTGAFFATALSGSVCLQTFLYIRHYPNDYKNLKALVAATWGMDTAQTICITTLCYQYMTLNFTRPEIADYIFRTVAASIALTALLTVTVNGFFCHRVHKLSRGNWWLTVPTIFCLAARLGLAIATSIETSKLQSFKLYGHRFRWLLTSALALSATSDVIVTAGLCYYLRRLNRGMYSTQKMILLASRALRPFITCVCSFVALITLTCWLAMPNNLVYLGVHFTIGSSTPTPCSRHLTCATT
ncbi:hypothetical protein BC834DRAFT_40230 [Gloeopeniophorella convolvens]|nr:hypothetical protein BC834DRAFT_40230 [Gloeopeniophorella convolvens]